MNWEFGIEGCINTIGCWSHFNTQTVHPEIYHTFMAQWNCPQHYTRNPNMHGYVNVVHWRDRTVQFRRLLMFEDTSDNARRLHLRWSSWLTIKAWHRSYRYRMGVVHHIGNILWTNRCRIHVTVPIRMLSSIPTHVTLYMTLDRHITYLATNQYFYRF